VVIRVTVAQASGGIGAPQRTAGVEDVQHAVAALFNVSTNQSGRIGRRENKERDTHAYMMGTVSSKTRMMELVACGLRDLPPIREQISSMSVLCWGRG
jgi:hypothetical protein